MYRILFLYILLISSSYADTGVSLPENSSLSPVSMDSKNGDMHLEKINLEEGETAMQISLQKELFDILISDSNEVQEEYRKQNIFYKNKGLIFYQKIFQRICLDDHASDCPIVYFTNREMNGIASMYPNAVLAINEKLMTPLDIAEATFILAHEYAHYKYAHSLQRVKVIAKSVVDNGLMLREPEQALASAGFMPKVLEAHHRYEEEADRYAMNYLTSQNMSVDCYALFRKIAGDEIISQEKHPLVRCQP